MTIVAALVAALAGAAAAQATPRQTGEFHFTSTTPGAVTGNHLDVVFQNPDDPALKPYSVDQMIVHIPPGTVTDTTALPQCHATDAEIYAFGPAACPADSKIGSGDAYSAQGGGAPDSHSVLTHFNNQDEVVGIGVVDDVPITTIDRTKLEPDKSTSTFPLFPGVPPPEPYTPVHSLTIDFPPHEVNGRAYTRTPPTCPAAGYWTFIVDFKYRDGVTESIVSHSPCERRPARVLQRP
jgi:hypothetical protein